MCRPCEGKPSGRNEAPDATGYLHLPKSWTAVAGGDEGGFTVVIDSLDVTPNGLAFHAEISSSLALFFSIIFSITIRQCAEIATSKRKVAVYKYIIQNAIGTLAFQGISFDSVAVAE